MILNSNKYMDLKKILDGKLNLSLMELKKILDGQLNQRNYTEPLQVIIITFRLARILQKKSPNEFALKPGSE